MSKALTYASYLRLDELLELQSPRSQGPNGTAEHDELLFIVIHQIYELWFKELLHEAGHLQRLMRANEAARAVHTIHRLETILKTVVAQLDVMETMTPLEFSAFRGILESASGFQSAQFREIEFVFGYKRKSVLANYAEMSAARDRLLARLEQPTVWDAFLHFLSRNGYAVPTAQLERDVREPVTPSAEVQAILVAAYRDNSMVAQVCESLVDIDEGFQEWRYRHAKMVERTIGYKPGTGGSAGVAYLTSTIKPFFPDLWAIRSLL